jgi:probable F420-dependent oxidoreductase
MATRIGIGFSVSRSDLASAEQICAFAERVEGLGIDSIWPSDHNVSRQPSLDVHCLLALFAARTTKVKMGPSVLSLPARHPVHMAKTYATLDHLTGGRRRIICAVGLGGDARECEVVGVPANERGARMREGVEVMRRLWAEPRVSHEGRFYRFDDVTIDPRPVGGPLDVWIGGNSDLALKRVARYGDGWMPSFITAPEFSAGMVKLEQFCGQTGRTIEKGEAGALLLCHVGRDGEEASRVARSFLEGTPFGADTLRERCAFGTAEEVRDRIAEYVDAGCEKFVLFPVAGGADLLAQVDAIGTQIVPHFC